MTLAIRACANGTQLRTAATMFGIPRSTLRNKNIPKPVIVFMDGRKSHLTLHLATFCKSNGIVLVALLPNATHFLQPLDVGVFAPLKSQWKKLVHQWRMNHSGNDIQKTDIPLLLDQILKNPQFPTNCKSAFKCTGIYPFDKNALKYKEIIKEKTETCRKQLKKDSKHLVYLENKIPSEVINEFSDTLKRNIPWEGREDARMLFEVWKKCKAEIENDNERMNELIHDVESYEEVDDMTVNSDGMIESNEVCEPITTDVSSMSEENTAQKYVEKVTPNMQEEINEELEDDPEELRDTSKQDDLNKTKLATHVSTETPISRKSLKSLGEEHKKQLSEIFSDILRYPDDSKKKGRKRTDADNLPPVLTNEQFIQFHKKKNGPEVRAREFT